MQPSGYRYALMLFKEDGTALGQAPVTVDWEPAEEWTRFEAVRRGVLGPAEKANASLAPSWSEEHGEPYMKGFRVTVPGAGSDVTCEFVTAYFTTLAHRASSTFIERGELREGEQFRFQAVAFADTADARPRVAFETEEVMPAVPLQETVLGPMRERATPCAAPNESDVPVFIAGRALEEAVDLTRRAGANETGGVLIGHLHRDAEAPEVFVEVTAQIHARLAKGTSKKLSFTPEVWSDVDGVLGLRRSDEIVVGWWHSHPSRAWCAKCPPANQKICALARGFFSEHDRLLHRSVYPRAYSVALVVNDAVNGVTHAMYGWRKGLLEPRGFYVIDDDHQTAGQPDGGATERCGNDAE